MLKEAATRMALFNFADAYTAAGISPGPEIIRARQEAFDKLRQGLTTLNTLCLTRLYFGLNVPDGTDWFRDAFGESDPSFSMIGNQREAAVLSACLLSAALEDGRAAAGLALLTASAAGARVPLVRPELIEEARQALHKQAVVGRRPNLSDPKQIAVPKSKISAINDVLASQDWATAAALFTDASDRLESATTQVRNALVPLVAEITDLREEVEILWWYVGGWSRRLDKPFANLKPALACSMAGLDLADLTRGSVGPAAAPAVLHRLISGISRKTIGPVTIKAAVDAWPENSFELLSLNARLRSVPDICPVLTAFSKASEIGTGSAWNAPFERASNFSVTTPFTAIDLAMQVYREAMLVSLLD
jgi:hypothetical protein